MKSRLLVVLFHVSIWVVILSMLMSTLVWGAVGIGPVKIIAPPDGSLVGGSNVSVTAEFTTSGKKVDALRLYVDGQAYKSLKITPAASGTGTIVWDTTRFSESAHELVIELVSAGASIGRAGITVSINNGAMDVVPPIISFYQPKDGAVVSGSVRVAMQAWDNVGITYVQLFVDDTIKLITNTSPYSYVWDTTGYANGPHILKAAAYDTADNKGFSKSLKLIVNNPVVAAAVSGAIASAEASKPVPLINIEEPVIEAPSTPPVVSLPQPEKPRVEIAGKSLPSLVPPGPAPIIMTAAPKIEVPAIPAPVVPQVQPKIEVAPEIVPAAPPTPAVASTVTAPKPKLSAPSGRSAEPVIPTASSVRASAPTRMASIPKIDTKPALPLAVPMAEAKTAESPKASPGVNASSTIAANFAPSTVVSHPTVVPAGKPTVSKSPAAAVAPTASAVRVARIDPIVFAGKPATAPASAPAKPVKVDLRNTQAPALTAPPAPETAAKPAPKAEPKPVQVAALPKKPQDASCIYVVKAGEDIASIAAKTHVSADSIRKANAIFDDKVAPGMKLQIPAGIRMVMDRHELSSCVAPRLENGIAMAPFRDVVQRAGGIVNWIAPLRRISALRGFNQIVLELGSKEARVNGNIVVMEAAPYIEEGHTLVPLRFVENSLQIAVQYDPITGVIYMTSL